MYLKKKKLEWIFFSFNLAAAAAANKSLQSCLTLCDPREAYIIEYAHKSFYTKLGENECLF